MERYNSLLKQFIKDNEYFCYQKIIDLIEKIIKEKERFAIDFFYFMSEYGEPNHDICKTIYENLFDKDIVNRCGRQIADRGGKESLIACYYIILNCSPLINSENKREFNIITAQLLNDAFDGIKDKDGDIWKK